MSNRESLRDFVLATQAHSKKAFHLGFGRHASRSTMSDANSKRDYRIFYRGYNDFRPNKWTRRFPPGSGILSDDVGYMDGQLTMEKDPDKIRRIKYWDEENS